MMCITRRRPWAVTPAVLLLLLVAAAVRAQPAAQPALEVSVVAAKRTLVYREPLLVVLSLRNASDRPLAIEPLYFAEPGYPLAIDELRVTNQEGVRLVSWASRPARLYAPARTADDYNGRIGRTPRRLHAWELAPGTRRVTYVDVSSWWPALHPGQYHVELRCRSSPQQWNALREQWGLLSESAADLDIWVDLGRFSVTAPQGDDAEALEWWETNVDGPAGCMIAVNALSARYQYAQVLARWPESSYAPYMRYTDLWFRAARAMKGDPTAGYAAQYPPGLVGFAEIAQSESEGFAKSFPDFPLNYQWGALAPLASLAVSALDPSTTADVSALAASAREAALATEDLKLLDYIQEYEAFYADLARLSRPGGA